MTVAAWCKQNGICEQTYYRNLKKLQEEACGLFPVFAQSDKPTVFKQLQIRQPVSDGNSASSACRTELHMLGDIKAAEHIYIACGYTDMRKSIDGLAALVQKQFCMDPFSLFLFCGRRRDRIKGLLW